MTTRFDVGAMLGRYRLLERIGGGGMGEVFRAADPLLGREVAIKIARTPGPVDRERFLAEARHAARVVHPNLVGIFDLGIQDDDGFLAMELVQGTPISQLVRRGPSEWRVVAAIGEGVAAGLAALHAASLVHRDVKPANVMLDLSGVVKLVDFGIATLEDVATDEIFVGTPGYIAPELILGQRPRRSADVFALGVVLYELVTSQRLFSGESAYARAMAVTQHVPPRLPASRVPDWLADLVDACLARDLEQRPRDAAEVLSVLRAHGPHVGLGALAREIRLLGDATQVVESDGDTTTVASPIAPLFGRDAILASLTARRARTVWLHGPPGSGKTRLVSELALRTETGATLIVESATDEQALPSALGLESGLHADAVRAALNELSPTLVVLEDVPADHRATERWVAAIRREVPGALCVVTSDEPPPSGLDAEAIALMPLSARDAEEMLRSRLHQPRWASARALAPLAQGNPLGLSLLALGIERADQSLDGLRGVSVIDALVSGALVTLTPLERGVAERLAVMGERGALLLRADDLASVDAALATLDAYGLMEMRDAGPTMRRAVRGSIAGLLSREGRRELLQRECDERLHRTVLRLSHDARHGEASAMRIVSLLRPEIVLACERALERPTTEALIAAVEMLHAVLEPFAQKVDAALPLLASLMSALGPLAPTHDALARARIARTWALDDDLDEARTEVEEALRSAEPHPSLFAQALVARASIEKRRGRSAATRSAYEQVLAIALARGDVALATFARSELALGAMRAGDVEPGRELLQAPREPASAEPYAARTAVNHGLLALELGLLPLAMAELDRAIASARALGQSRFVVGALTIAVEVRVRLGDLEGADNAVRQVLLAARTLNARLPMLFAHQMLAVVSLSRGEWLRALRALHEAGTVSDGAFDPTVIARGHALFAVSLALAGEQGVDARIEAAASLLPALTPDRVVAIRTYLALARAAFGEDAALEELESLIETTERAPDAESERMLAACVARTVCERARLRRATVPGPFSG